MTSSISTLSLLSRVQQELRRPRVGEIEITEALHYLGLVEADLRREAAADKEDVVWLVERQKSYLASREPRTCGWRTEYVTMDKTAPYKGDPWWTTDPQFALRFCRKADAENFMENFFPAYANEVTEHIFYTPRAQNDLASSKEGE